MSKYKPVYGKKLKKCADCDMCFLRFMDILVPEISKLEECPDCGNKWIKNNYNYMTLCLRQ